MPKTVRRPALPPPPKYDELLWTPEDPKAVAMSTPMGAPREFVIRERGNTARDGGSGKYTRGRK